MALDCFSLHLKLQKLQSPQAFDSVCSSRSPLLSHRYRIYSCPSHISVSMAASPMPWHPPHGRPSHGRVRCFGLRQPLVHVVRVLAFDPLHERMVPKLVFRALVQYSTQSVQGPEEGILCPNRSLPRTQNFRCTGTWTLWVRQQ